jgi:hypothetical protein
LQKFASVDFDVHDRFNFERLVDRTTYKLRRPAARRKAVWLKLVTLATVAPIRD